MAQWIIPALVSGMFIAGCSNSLLTKYQDNQCVEDCDSDRPKLFEQPVFQTVQMFVAEMLCWVMHLIISRYERNHYVDVASTYQPVGTVATAAGAAVGGIQDNDNTVGEGYEDEDDTLEIGPCPELKGKQIGLLSLPALMDTLATTLMNLGLLLVPVSVYQMMRGAIVLFVGVLSTLFLKHRITRTQWLGLLAVMGGVFLVGISATFKHKDSGLSSDAAAEKELSAKALAGVGMILFGQLFTATQFVYEEHLLEHHTLPPLRLVAWEGTFGALITVVGSIIVYYIMPSRPAVFNLGIGLDQVTHNTQLIWSSIGIMISMATFNFCGISVTRTISATSRSTIDTCRTLGIWLVSLALGWEKFQFLQLFGFALLVYGTLLFNGLIGNQSAKDPLPNEFEHS